jgi:hypothetical protein
MPDIKHFTDKEQYLFSLLCDDTQEAFLKFPASKQKAILSLPEDQVRRWDRVFSNLQSLRNMREQLKFALNSKAVPIDRIDSAVASFRSTAQDIEAEEREEQRIINGFVNNFDNGLKNYDRFARPGVLSIRPSLKGGYPPSITRKPKVVYSTNQNNNV